MKKLIFISALIFLTSCSNQEKKMELISANDSGIDFSNTIDETSKLHYFSFPYIYIGGGVGVGDFDNDGLNDIFFAGNMVSSKLYKNKGEFKFDDVTDTSGITGQYWANGVSVVDVNQDGLLDIYVSVGGFAKGPERENKLFINNGDFKFVERAKSYGIADSGHSTQSAFFDYDRDGDLDLYVMTHANESPKEIEKLYTKIDGSGPSTDRLYKNKGLGTDGHPIFENVSKKAGVLIEGYGLGLAISDINQDGWPDIYVANDFVANDLLYINNQNGTFTNRLPEYVQHTSRNGMGIDISDINNDALPDILVMDMLPEINKRQKTMTASMNHEHFKQTLREGFSPQFIRNTLQLNQGKDLEGKPMFSEIGRYSGLHQTDWSWSPLIADFNNDGQKDVYITNGFRRDITNHDFTEYSSQADIFKKGKLSEDKLVERLRILDSIFLPNYIFSNDGKLKFKDETQSWGMDQASLSNGAVYADFDNDGDLDLVVNNINSPAFIYRNNSDKNRENHFIEVKLKGSQGNLNGIGTKLTAYLPNGEQQYYDYSPVKGYMSSTNTNIHIGLGSTAIIDSLRVGWLDGAEQVLTNLKVDTLYTIQYDKAKTKVKNDSINVVSKNYLLTEILNDKVLDYSHEENDNSDFRGEPLLLHLNDFNGPGIATGDINGDGRKDLYIGGARNYKGKIFLQNVNGTFDSISLPGSEKYEDLGALFFDADGDDDLDLYVVSGGSSVKYFEKGHYQDRLYTNKGNDIFEHEIEALPEIKASGSCVVAADFDSDGDLDLFVGGMIVPGSFPNTPNSYLLENENGKFVDVTEKKAKSLQTIGLVSSALWTDYDNDDDLDLMVAGEWMPITLFENNNGILNKVFKNGLENFNGFWNSLVGKDFDHDGDIDYIAGNHGENTAFKVSENEPMRVYAKDFDLNSSVDPIITRYIKGKEVPLAPRGELAKQLVSIKRIFPTYDQFAEAEINDILKELDTTKMQVLEVNYLSSSYIENLGNGSFSITPLAQRAQFSPLFGLATGDFNFDGFDDVIGVGNYYPTEVISGWYDAGKGVILKGNNQGDFTPVLHSQTGFKVEKDARALVNLPLNDSTMLWVASVNSNKTKRFSQKLESRVIELMPGEVNAKIYFKNGKMAKQEYYFGAGYLSQASNIIQVHDSMDKIIIYNKDGISREVVLSKMK
ncbi:VCBS repeat-containing protein [Zobellia roscoffensis]|uniref:VCBS repeat-containing protein n=1 Tax=Zobellia roscoffensis TaxID=2779508 RepID=UPI00188DB6A4|nr:FG-GAP-like repeat-containing protein [Zobellia roscoffensis]